MPVKRKAQAERVRPVVAYPREAVLNKHQLARGLGVSVDLVLKQNFPFAMIGKRERFVWGQILDILAERALPTATENDRVAAARSIEHLRMARRAS